MRVELLFASRYLKAVEFQGRDVTLTITGVKLEELEDTAGQRKKKGIVSFRETEKQLVLNRTNAMCIARMFGSETDDWAGKRVTLYPIPHRDPQTKEDGFAIRVRGSPDIPNDIVFNLQLPRKKPQQVRLVRTQKGPNQ